MRLLVFSDLDGTLLDHQTYSYDPARPALDRLKRLGSPLILSTSKTAAEVAPLHAELGLGDAPAIVENGAGLYRPGEAAQDDSAYRRLRAVLADLNAPFRGFGDMTDAEVSEVTGLTLARAALARQRCFSEPGLWRGDDLDAFTDTLSDHGITARQGGRFLTLSFGRTKADALREVAQDMRADTTIALGDAPNDLEMLNTATYGVIIRNTHGPGLPTQPGEATGTIRRTHAPGPTGWNAAMTDILTELTEKGAFDG